MQQPYRKEGNQEESSPAFHFFLYLLLFLSLFFVALGSGSILFQLIDKNFSDPLMESYAAAFDQSSAKFGIAALFVAAPIFFFISRLVNKNVQEGAISEESSVRKWLTYIVLFFAAATVLGDLIMLVVFFLEGDFPMRFLLKVATVLLIAGSVFVYYFQDIRQKDALAVHRVKRRMWGYASGVVIAAVFIAGFFIIDSPTVSREKKQDAQVIAYLSSIDSQINYYYTENHVIPESLDELSTTKYEPQQKINFDAGVMYIKKSATTFGLCANFKQSNESDIPYAYEYGLEWKHASGKKCFQRSVVSKETQLPAGSDK